MTLRKPDGVTWRSWIDGQVAASHALGEFDNLPGTGKPIADLHKPYDEMWWTKQLMTREGLGFLPPPLLLRREVEKALESFPRLPSERALIDAVDKLNKHIQKINSTSYAGPRSGVSVVDGEAQLVRWRKAQDDRPPLSPWGPTEEPLPWSLAAVILGSVALSAVLLFWTAI